MLPLPRRAPEEAIGREGLLVGWYAARTRLSPSSLAAPTWSACSSTRSVEIEACQADERQIEPTAVMGRDRLHQSSQRELKEVVKSILIPKFLHACSPPKVVELWTVLSTAFCPKPPFRLPTSVLPQGINVSDELS